MQMIMTATTGCLTFRRRLAMGSLMAVVCVRSLAAQAAQPESIVYLDRSRGWAITSGDRPHLGVLAREISRQAFLIAAREELKLSTRDAWLGDSLPQQGDNPPFDVVSSAGNPSLLEVVRGFEGRQALLWQQETKPEGKPFDYPHFVAHMEALSRGEFVDLLKKAGFQRRESAGAKARAAAASAEMIESWLNEMTFTSQFAALGELHSQLQERAESPQLLSQLARGYANLGVLTEYFWSPMHEVFKARALLYAERFVVRGKASASSLACRGYVRAMIGLHAAALDDFSQAAATQKQRPPAGGDSLPDWTGLLEGFCRFDAAALKKPANPRHSALAALLRLMAAELSDTPGLIPRVAATETANAPECFRIQDGFMIHYGEDQAGRPEEHDNLPPNGEAVLARTLDKRLQSFADLPSTVAQLLAKDAAARAGAKEPELRGKVILALLATEPAPAGGNASQPLAGSAGASTAGRGARSEMPWSLLGRIIQEVSFFQAWRVLRPETGHQDEVSLARLLPATPTHRYRGFLEMAQRDPTANRSGYTSLLRARDLDALTFREYPIIKIITALDWREEARVDSNLIQSADHLPGDIALRMKFPLYTPDSQARLMSSVTPYAPMVRANLQKSAGGKRKARTDNPSPQP